MPAPDTSVKLFHSSMVGAPVLSTAPGAMIAVLDACLVNGFGGGAVDSITVSAGVATVTRGAGHPFDAGSVAEIGGAVPAGLNGQKRVLSVLSATSYTFDAEGIADQTATGSITQKLAAAGWEKAFSGTDLAAYRSLDVTGTRLYLRVDDTAVRHARVVGYESMSSINAGVAPTPTPAVLSGGVFLGKSNAVSGSAARGWVVLSDSRGFYVFVDNLANNNTGWLGSSFFGDIASNRSPDAYGFLVAAPSVAGAVDSNPGQQTGDLSYTAVSSDAAAYLARGASGLGGAVWTRRQAAIPFGVSATVYSGSTNSFFMNFPNPSDGGLYVTPLTVCEPYGALALRGVYPGAYFVPQSVGPNVFPSRATIDGVLSLPGRRLMAVTTPNGVMFYDVTGPWR